MSNRYPPSYRNNDAYSSAKRQEDDYDPFGDGYASDRYASPAQQSNPRRPPTETSRGPTYGPPASRIQRAIETSAERQISQVLELIKAEWPAMVQNDCIPVSLALQLLDNSSVGRAHEYRGFKKTHQFLQDSLKNIVHEHHQGFNSSIGTFHKIQGSIQASQKRVRVLKDSLAASRTSLAATDPELKKLYKSSQMYDEVLQTLNELEDLRTVPDQLEARISEKRFLSAVEVLQNALRKLRKPELDDIGALGDLRSYLANQETALMDILIEELHEHLYLKSPYCQERWQNLAKNQGAYNENYGESSAVAPFHLVLDTMDLDRPVTEDPAKNPEADTFWYISLIVDSLNKLGRLENAVDTLKQRLPVELFSIVNETINDVDQRHPSSLRGGSGNGQGLHIYGTRETQMRADVIYDLLWTLYGKFEAIAESHRVFHEATKALVRREGTGAGSYLLGSFKELWNLYQNEIRSLLHNYVTTDADVYQFNSFARQGAILNGAKDTTRDHLFKFSEADPKSDEMTTEYEALDGIIRAAVPGLTSNSRKTQTSDRKLAAGRESRRSASAGTFDSRGAPGSYKSLVEPSVFNMSLLLPPTLVFLQRLKSIVPPGSDLAASTLTSFLDNFLVNVFQPQLDETLSKLSDHVFGEVDSFQQDSDWSLVARRPVFKGTIAFFTVITAFCRMLGTIPHDQALSSLIISQMARYYERCFTWFKSLVAKAQEPSTTRQSLRYSAELVVAPGDLQQTVKEIWVSDSPGHDLISKEVGLLIAQSNDRTLEPSDIIQDRDVISSLCLLYTSMKWLSVKAIGLRHITHFDTDSSRPTLPKNQKRRWTILNNPSKANGEQQGPVHLPMTQDTVQSFDDIVSSYEEFATTVLLTLHMEIRCRIVQSLSVALSPKTSPYLLGDQEIKGPDPQVLSLNAELVAYDETVARFLRDREIAFVRTGLGLLVNTYLVSNALVTQPMNSRGCERMQLNILVLQQNLKNIEAGVDLARAATYFSLFQEGAYRIVDKAKRDREREAEGATVPESSKFTYDELKALIELCYSEQLADPERGVASAARRQMGERVLALSEHMWQS
ncbi:Sec8 exocyst complex component-specific domain-containing protein [Durotheca rogersii]|uniref:Sec8 exocyst complex component-specific domain-containing protein n=1 Tax=Durotheca rogersii TaxID=419775 RepID=UPI00221F9412|nr:Sec8 exocyst complex component-specific domain-containing protein [Durotheca rogersii]KAI5856216.1 Sec8 exocyst complex component-specific domain-containing protein [Durotheca rogersii]